MRARMAKNVTEDLRFKSFGYWVTRLQRAMQTTFLARLAEHGVTSAEWVVLGQIKQGVATPVEIADRMNVDRAAVSRLLSQLEHKRLILRSPHARDKRSAVFSLTEDGEALLPLLVQASQRTNDEFLRLLPAEERTEISRLIRKLGERVPQGRYKFD